MVSRGGSKLDKADVDYTDKGHAPEFCKACKHFDAPDSCDVVEGKIASLGWCRLWKRQS